MKPDNPFQEIDDLLCSQKPEPLPSPGLESRIRRALHARRQPPPRRWWPWLLLPPALAGITLIMMRPAADIPAPQVIRQPEPPRLTSGPAIPSLAVIEIGNSLNAETAALGRDAKRTRDFLIDCLPSIASRDE